MPNPERPWLFQKGRSGNPAGRPKGSKNKATQLAETLLEGDADALTRTALDQAIGGDGTLLRFFLSRLLAEAKHQPTRFALPEMTGRPARDAAHAYNAVMQAVAAGEIPVEQALRLAEFIERRKAAQEEAIKEERVAAARARRAAGETEEDVTDSESDDTPTRDLPPRRPAAGPASPVPLKTVFSTVFSDADGAGPMHEGVAAAPAIRAVPIEPPINPMCAAAAAR